MTLALYALALLAAVALGARLDRLVRMTHRRTQLLMSLISGVLLGIAIFHLLPHSVYIAQHDLGDGTIDHVAPFIMLGLLFMFFLQRFFRSHQHEYDGRKESEDSRQRGHLGGAGFGVVLGLVLHSIVDGVALGSSMQSDAAMGISGLVGFSVFFAILLHKPLDALTLSFFMRQRGVSTQLQWLLLGAYALVCPAVVASLLLVLNNLGIVTPGLMAAALGFSCGVFLCVALSDLLPEIHFHDHDRGKMAGMLLVGVGLSLLIGVFEPAHRHQAAGVGHAAEGGMTSELEAHGVAADDDHGDHAHHGH